MKENEAFSGAVGVLAASVLWGTTGTAATFAPGVSPIAIGSAAMGVGGIMQALIAAHLISSSHSILAEQWKLLMAGSIAIGIYPLAFYSSMNLAGVAVGTVVSIGFAPIVSALLERIIDGKKLAVKWKAGAAIGVAGATLLSLAKSGMPHPAAASFMLSDITGVFLGLVAAFAYAFYSYAAHRLMQRGIASRAAMGALFGMGGILLIPVLICTGGPFLESRSNITVGIYMAAVPMFIGYRFFGYGLSRIPASTATTLSLFEPAVAALLAVVIVGEQLTPMAWTGIGLIAGCLFILTSGEF